MKAPGAANLEDKVFLLLLATVTLAFGWILWPFYGAVFWAAVLAILFAPVNRRLCRSLHQRTTPAALLTLFVILVIVILPSAVIASMLFQEALGVYGRFQSGELNFGRYLERVLEALPPWVSGLLERFELTSLSGLQGKVATGLSKGAQLLAGQALNVGQNTFNFVIGFFLMLYLLFFLLRDGSSLVSRIRGAIPLEDALQRNFFGKFTRVVRATVKGNVVVALVQGFLGGLILWLLDVNAPVLWGVVMAFLSLLPAVGTALVWGPIAVYFLATGSIWQGLVLIAYGVLVIGLVDNLLRPILVGKDTRMPDYVVLISTLGGMAIFGLNGFVIGPLIAAMFIAAWDVVAASKTVDGG